MKRKNRRRNEGEKENAPERNGVRVTLASPELPVNKTTCRDSAEVGGSGGIGARAWLLIGVTGAVMLFWWVALVILGR